jgi:hypothetical protein
MKMKWSFLLLGILLAFTKLAWAREDIDVGYYYVNQDPDYFYFTPKIGYGTTFESWQVFPSISVAQKFKRAAIIAGVDLGYHFRGMPFSLELGYDFIGDRKYAWSPMFEQISGSVGTYVMHSQAVTFSGRYDYQGFESFNPYFSFGMGAGIHNGKFTFINPMDPSKYIETTSNENGLLLKFTLGGAIKMSSRIAWIFEADYFYWPGTRIFYTIPTERPVDFEFARSKHFHVLAIMTGLSFGF